MPLVRFRVGNNELAVFASEETLNCNATLSNAVWSFFYRIFITIPRFLLRPRAPLTVATVIKRPSTTMTGNCTVEVWDDAPEEAKLLAKRVSEQGWYHTFDLGHGIITPGAFDHSPIVERCKLPESLAGMRVLDVACFDGFWAFEFERRGADEVVALDVDTARELDFPPPVRSRMTEEELSREMGKGFKIVHNAKQSKVKRVHCNIYDLTPEVAGMFDLVHIGDVLLHLQSPAKALAKVREVTNFRFL